MKKSIKILLGILIGQLIIVLFLCGVIWKESKSKFVEQANNNFNYQQESKRNTDKKTQEKLRIQEELREQEGIQAQEESQKQEEGNVTKEVEEGLLPKEKDGIDSINTFVPANTSSPTNTPIPIPAYEEVILSFAGDILLADDASPINAYYSRKKGLSGIFSEDLIQEMRKADVFMLNNEFAFSKRGTKTPDKSYTFRANPDKVQIFQDMGVDIVSVANNHSLDFGVDALLDTFDTLDNADIDYVGGGVNLDRARQVIYKKAGGRVIGYIGVAKTIFADSWIATSERTGILASWNEKIVKESIQEAKENSDYVVVYVHWGVEKSSYPEEYQRDLAKTYIDSGADIVLGCHPHVIQGVEFYKGKPIIYSLGNYWFSSYKRESMFVKVKLKEDGEVQTYVLPCMTGDFYTYMLREKEADKYYKKLEQLSFDVIIDKNGLLQEEVP